MENEITRHARFEHIRKTVVEAQDYLLTGVDVAKELQHACFMLSSGRMLEKNFRFENNRKGFEGYVRRIREYQKSCSPKETVVALETTGNYMLPLAHYLEEEGIYVVMVSSMVAKRNRDTMDLSWNKNDVKDAWNVTDCIRQGKILYFSYKEGVYNDARRKMTLYTKLSKERGLYKVRLQNNVLCVLFPEFHKVFDKVDELVPLTILKHYPTPRDIANVDEEFFVEDIVRKTDPIIKQSKLRRIYAIAKESIGCREDITSALIAELRHTLAEIERINSTQEDIRKEIQDDLADLEEYQLIQTVPGIGPITAAIFISEIGNIDNFRSSRQILKLAGLDLARSQSGTFAGSWKVSKRGRPSLRAAAYQSGLVAARNDSPLREKYRRICEAKKLKPGEKRKAIVAISCKVLRIVFSILKTKRPYNPNFENKIKVNAGMNSENSDLSQAYHTKAHKKFVLNPEKKSESTSSSLEPALADASV